MKQTNVLINSKQMSIHKTSRINLIVRCNQG